MTKAQFFKLLSRVAGTDDVHFFRDLCWFVSVVERRYWKVGWYAEAWNVLYQAKLTMPGSELAGLDRGFREAILAC